jgi:hypothetical protein
VKDLAGFINPGLPLAGNTVRSFKFIIKVALENNTVLLTIIENVLPRFGNNC